jgi:hypothetical protein
MFVVITSKTYWLFYFPVPGPVISPVAFSFGKDWIHLRWGAPYPPLGELELCKVEYKLKSDWFWHRKEVSINKTCKLWDGNICFNLNSSDGITGNEVYNIKVSDTVIYSFRLRIEMLAVLTLMKGFVSAVYIHICMFIIISITLTAKMFISFSHTVCCMFFYGSFL